MEKLQISISGLDKELIFYNYHLPLRPRCRKSDGVDKYKKKLKAKVICLTLKHKYIVLIGVLCLFIVVLQAQIRPKQLRNEILQTQLTPMKSVQKVKKAKKVKPVPTYKPLAPV